MSPGPLGLYLHIPFCEAICTYCNFNRGLLDADLKTRYVGALEREVRAAGDGRRADTVFFGGGTPSLLEPEEVARLISACREAYDLAPDAEVTLETNPETVTVSRLDAFRQAGVTRLSVGVQTFDGEQLARLGRIHTAERATDAIRAARTAGFANVSFDLMFWLPGQSRASWLDTVERAIDLEPDHLSLYLLELYPNAPLKESMVRAHEHGAAPAWTQAADDDAADMYLEACARLDAVGLIQYEISNVARPGLASRHNLKYWQGGDWRGFGCGAHSTVDGVRWHNVASTIEFIDRTGTPGGPGQRRRHLSAQEQLEESLFTGLRLVEGVSERNIRQRFGVDPWGRYGSALQPFQDAGLLWRRDGWFGLSRRGMLVANEILVTFV